MKKIMDMIKKRFGKNNNSHMTYEHFQKLKKDNKVIGGFKDSLLDTFSGKAITKGDYESFIHNNKYSKKDFDSFFQYYHDRRWDVELERNPNVDLQSLKSRIMEDKFRYQKTFHAFLLGYIKEYVDGFLSKGKENEDFILDIKLNKPFLLDAISEENIAQLYEKNHQEYNKEHGKNEFGLDNKYVDEQLKKIFRHREGVGDGTFLYKWTKGKKDNGISKYNKAINNELYNKIEPTEKSLFEYILSGNLGLGSSKTIYHHKQYSQIKNILDHSKSIIELGPGAVNKLLEYMKMFCESTYYTPSGFFGERHTILMDVNPLSYTGVKKELDEVIEGRNGIVEGMESNFENKDSAAYKSEDPCYFILGGTIGNFTINEILGLLKNMKSKKWNKHTNIFLTYFPAPDKQKLSPQEYKKSVDKLKAMYGDPSPENQFHKSTNKDMEDFVLSGFEALGIPRYREDEKKNKIPILQYVVEYKEATTSTPAMIKLGARFTEKTTITTKTGETFPKNAGNVIWAVQSSRFTEAEFQDIIKKSGYSIIMNETDKEGGLISVAVLQSKLGMNDKEKKTRNRVYGSLAGLTLLGGGVLTQNAIHQKQIKQQQDKIDTEFVKEKKMMKDASYGYQPYELKTTTEKIEYLNKLTDRLFQNISIRYNIQDNEAEVKKTIKSYIKDKEILGRLSDSYDDARDIFALGTDFVEKYRDVLVEEDPDVLPYDHLTDYEVYFRELILDSTIVNEQKVHIRQGKDGEITHEYRYVLDPSSAQSSYSDIILQCIKGEKETLVEEREKQVDAQDDLHINMYLSNRTDVVDHYVKDGYLYIKRWHKDRYGYNYIVARNGDEKIDPVIIAYDYFYQNRPIIKNIHKKFAIMYGNPAVTISLGEVPQAYSGQEVLKMLIIKDLLKTGLINTIASVDDRAIITYIKRFVKRNAAALQKEGISILPYDAYQREHAEAFKNTRIVKENNVPEVITYGERSVYDFDYIGKYYTQAGAEYDLAEATVTGKKYLFARNVSEDNEKQLTEEGLEMPVVNYYLSRGKEVAKDCAGSKNIIQTTSSALAENITMSHPRHQMESRNDKLNSKSKGFNAGLQTRKLNGGG